MKKLFRGVLGLLARIAVVFNRDIAHDDNRHTAQANRDDAHDDNRHTAQANRDDAHDADESDEHNACVKHTGHSFGIGLDIGELLCPS